MSAKIVAIIDSTAPLGVAVTKTLCMYPEFEVRCLSSKRMHSDFNSVYYDVHDRHSIQSALNGAHAAFVTTTLDCTEDNCLEEEKNRGLLIADVCRCLGIQHVIYCSQLNSFSIKGIMVRHMVAKAEVEEYMRTIGLPITCLILPMFYEEFCGVLRPRSYDGNIFELALPTGFKALDMISMEDVGPIVVNILNNRSSFLTKTISPCGDKLTLSEIVFVFNRYLAPKSFKGKQISLDEFRKLKDVPGALDWAQYFSFQMREDQRYNIHSTQKLNPNVQTFEQWVIKNYQHIVRSLS